MLCSGGDCETDDRDDVELPIIENNEAAEKRCGSVVLSGRALDAATAEAVNSDDHISGGVAIVAVDPITVLSVGLI